jgi:hypothetical protein
MKEKQLNSQLVKQGLEYLKQLIGDQNMFFLQKR